MEHNKEINSNNFISEEAFVKRLLSVFIKLRQADVEAGNLDGNLLYDEKSIEKFTILDSLAKERLLTKTSCAKIVHDFLRKVLKEAESDNWDPAKELLDLYDCNTCVAHIAECYVKGIMDEKLADLDESQEGGVTATPVSGVTSQTVSWATSQTVSGVTKHANSPAGKIFFGKDLLTIDEVDVIIERTLNADKRVKRVNGEATIDQSISLVPREDLKKWITDKDFVNIIDVRYKKENCENNKDSILNLLGLNGLNCRIKSFDLDSILNNPYILGDSPKNTGEIYLFICEEGYKSMMAAKAAYMAGYKKVYYSCLVSSDN
ncbi:MAG: hypothetical protein MJ123_01230 [Lachnospiraceae bacterium]|nr:hypothetical protein [Lachnospiraceae bacterium]